MSTPISSIARTASGLTWVASVPALCGSKRSPPRWRSRASAIWLLAELCVHRNRTLARSPTSAADTGHAPLLGSGEQALRGLAEQLRGSLPVEGVEAPLPTPLLAHQPCVLELLHVVGNLRLAHAEDLLELADADAFLPLASGTPESEKSQQLRPSAIMLSILTLMGSERARPRATSRSISLSWASLRAPFSSKTPSSPALTASSRPACALG